ncbi:hypothetical protein M501DRAFT_943191, partial [Patellaria atrata CBS 101060]
GGDENWHTIKADGGSDTFDNRKEKQAVRFTRSETPGVLVETILGVPGKTVEIY